MKRAVLASLALLAACPAIAGDMQSPRTIMSKIDWAAAATDLQALSIEPLPQVFGRLNAVTAKRFPDVAKSSVPVLLPIDNEALRQDVEAGKADIASSNKYFGEFAPSKFFLAGPAGYDTSFWIDTKAAGLKLVFPKPVEVEIGGAAFVYDLDEPNHQEVFPPAKALAEKFPGMKRILRENHVRFVFEKFGVPYVVSIQCYDHRVTRKHLTCREADQIAIRFLDRLQIAGGTPTPNLPEPKIDLSRPTAQSPDFTYYGPGDLIANSGWKKMPGRVDYNVYARMRFPFANAPGYVKSQSFLNWGDCYRTGKVGRTGKKGAKYHCKVNDKPLIFDESASENWTYPWQDNFCEMRDFLVGQCPGGYGHQGQDMRPSNCVLFNAGSDRCLPYQHTIAAVRDGPIWRTAGYLAAYITLNNANEHVRFRYLHMNPKTMDEDGLVSGRFVSEGEILGKVATWGDKENGTSYHLHFNMQVFTKSGWVWVNPYMTLVASYERLIGARGTEILPGQPAPPIPDKPPVILNPTPAPAAAAAADASPQAKPAQSAKPQKPRKARKKKRSKANDS